MKDLCLMHYFLNYRFEKKLQQNYKKLQKNLFLKYSKIIIEAGHILKMFINFWLI